MILVSGTSSGLGRYLCGRFEAVAFRRSAPVDDYRQLEYDAVIHCAFRSQRVVRSADLFDYFDDNTLLTLRLASLRFRKFIFLSTVDVYPRTGKVHREDEEISLADQESPYGITKLLSEAAVRRLSSKSLILRVTSMIGEYTRPTMLARLLLEPNSSLSVSADSHFNFINHSDVGDFVEASLKLDLTGTFNLASASNVVLKDLAEELGLRPKFGLDHYDVGQFDVTTARALANDLERGSFEKAVVFAKRVRAGLVQFATPPLPS
jgi:nucleoside-diphosphate-sugar epimerase